METGKLIDIHCHTGGIGAGGSGCFISRRMRSSFKYRAYLRALDTTEEDLEREGDRFAVRRISETLSSSGTVGKAVLLALDGVVENSGILDGARTEVYTPNEFIAEETRNDDRLLFGASVNPLRRDAIDRLHMAAEDGAVLVKWLPNIQNIDPADERHIPFYLAMKELGLPLLSHTGTERSFMRHDDKLGDPELLRLPLSLGLTVIAAHCGGNGRYRGEKSLYRFIRLCGEFPNLYGDLSASTQINVLGNLPRIIKEKVLRGRLLYGTDMPLMNTPVVTPFAFPFSLPPAEMFRLARIENPWDRDLAMKVALGLDLTALADPATVLRLPRTTSKANVQSAELCHELNAAAGEMR